MVTKMSFCLCAVHNQNVTLPVYQWQQKCHFASVLFTTKMSLCLCAVQNKNVTLPVYQ